MATRSAFSSVSYRSESSFCEEDTDGTLYKDFSGGHVLDFNITSIKPVTDAPSYEPMEARRGPYEVAPYPDSYVASGAYIDRGAPGNVEGELNVLRNLGTIDLANVNSDPIVRLFSSSFRSSTTPSVRTLTVSASSEDQAFEVTEGESADLKTGALIGFFDTKNKLHVTRIVGRSIAAGVATMRYSPALPAELEDDDVIHLSKSFGSALDDSDVGSSGALDLHGEGFRQILGGTRIQDLEFILRDHLLAAKVNFAFGASHITSTNNALSNIAEYPYFPAGSQTLSSLAGSFFASSAIDYADADAPRVAGRLPIDYDEATIKISNVLKNVQRFGGFSGLSDIKVADTKFEASFKQIEDASETLRNDFHTRTYRTYCQSYGPGAGFGIVIPAAFTTVSGKAVEMDGELGIYNFNLKAGRPMTETIAVGETGHLANCPIVFGFIL